MKHEEIVLYHNPRCSKSRAALELLRGRGMEPKILEYLKTPPDATALKDVLAKLGSKPGDIVRKGEEIFKARFSGRELTDNELLQAMADNPILIERPIAIRGERAVLGRPPEKVLSLLD